VKGECRSCRRFRRFEEHGVVSARLRGGRQVWLVDVSPNGASFESPSRLVPGALVHLQLKTRDQELTAAGRVIHCSVTRVEPDGLWYRKGVAFSHAVDWRMPVWSREHAGPGRL
jgi:hypothetical protein